MKKTAYPLLAVILLLLAGIAVLFFMNQDKQRQIDTLGEQVATLTAEQTTWQAEKARWDADKAQMGQSLGQVHAALSRTLLDVQGISSSIDSALTTVGEAYTAAALPAGVLSPLGADSPSTPPATAPSTQPYTDKPQDVSATAPDTANDDMPGDAATATPASQDEPSTTTAPAGGDARDTTISPEQDTTTHAAGSDQAGQGEVMPSATSADEIADNSTNTPTPSEEIGDNPSDSPTENPAK